MALATLSVDFEARLAKLEEGLNKAGRMNEKTAADIEKRWASMQLNAQKLGASLAAAFSVQAVSGWVRSTVDGLDALNDLKDATGGSIENLSALEDVGARTGTSFESVSAILVKFNKVLSDSKPGTEAANIIKKLGLNAEELKKIDPAEALRQTAVALATFTDDGDKARVVQELFGKSVQEAAPFLKDLAEQGGLVAKVTTEQAQAAEDFNKQLFNLEKNSTDSARALASQLVPALNQLFDALGGKAVGGNSALTEYLTVPLQAVSVLGANVAFVLKGIGKEIGGIGAQAAAVASLDFAGAASIGESMRADAKAARDEFDRLEQALMNIGRVLPQADYSHEGGRSTALKSIGGLPGADTQEKVSDFQKYIDKLKEAQAALLFVTDEEKARYETTFGKFAQYSPEMKAYAIDVAKTNDAIKALTKTEKQYVEATELDRTIAQQTKLNELLEKTPTAQLEKQRQLQVMIAEAWEQGRFGAVGSKEALDAYSEAVRTALPELERLEDENTRLFNNMKATIQDTFGQTLQQALHGDFDNIAQLWGDMIIRMVSEAAAAQLINALFGGSGSGGIGGLIAGLFSGGSSSGIAGNDVALAFADGGDPPVGRASLVGERGPELFVPKTAGTIIPNHKLGSVTNFDFSGAVYHFGDNVTPAQVQAAVEAGNAKTEARIRRSLRQGTYS